MATEDQVRRMAALYDGLNRVYGRYTEDQYPNPETGKLEGRAVTVREPVTEELWEAHLDGTQSLGIVPIDDNGMVSFAVVDIDDYSLTTEQINEVLIKYSIPMLPLHSKSKGHHITAYFEGKVPAKFAKEQMTHVLKLLGNPKADLFPRQVKLANSDDVGNWINMPYFGDSRKLASGKDLETFLTLAEGIRSTQDDWRRLKLADKARSERDEFPPCLQTFMEQGVPEGTRNTVLFNFAVLLKQMGGDLFANLQDYNDKYMDPPLSKGEVITVANQVGKMEYFYQCETEPLCSHCNKVECRKRKYGIGSGGELLANIQRLIKVETDPPVWYLEIDDHRIEISTDQLMNFQMLKKVALETLNRIIGQMKNNDWQEIVQKLLENLEIIHMPSDSGAHGAFVGMLSDFLTNNAASPNIEDLLNGVPHYDKKTGKYLFRLSDLMDYLTARKFTQYSTAKVSTKLRSMGAEYGKTRLKGKQVRWWSMEAPDDEQNEDFEVQHPEEVPLQ